MSSLCSLSESEAEFINEEAYFITQGSISFSNFFWTNIFNGYNIENAFKSASHAISNVTKLQNPLLYASGNGKGNESDDYNNPLLKETYIGNDTKVHGDSPKILPLETNPGFLHAEVTDNDGVARVWAVIIPPGHKEKIPDKSVLELPSFELMPVQDADNQYKGTYEKFNTGTRYQIAICARDRKGNTSVWEESVEMSENNLLRSRAIIVAGNIQPGDII